MRMTQRNFRRKWRARLHEKDKWTIRTPTTKHTSPEECPSTEIGVIDFGRERRTNNKLAREGECDEGELSLEAELEVR